MLKYVRELKFADYPDYSYINKLIQSAFKRNSLTNDGIYDWAGVDTTKKYAAALSQATSKMALTGKFTAGT